MNVLSQDTRKTYYRVFAKVCNVWNSGAQVTYTLGIIRDTVDRVVLKDI